MKELKGKCACGLVEYVIIDDLLYSGFCHCNECRNWSGAPFAASCGVTKTNFTLLKGKKHLKNKNKEQSSPSYYCQNCRTLIYGEVPQYNMIYVMHGTLTQPPSLKPQWHVYTNYKVDWYEILDDLPQYNEARSS